MLRTSLPDSIELPNGAVLFPVIGGHLKQRPFLTVVTKNGWGDDLIERENNLIIAEAKQQRLKYRRVSVLSRNLRGKLDLYRRQYEPTQWVFVEVQA